MNPIRNIIRGALPHDTKLNLLVAPFNGFFEQSLVKTGHNIYGLANMMKYMCPHTLVPNVKVLPNVQQVPISWTFDALICNDRVDQWQSCQQVAQLFHIPMIVVEHYHPQHMLALEDIDSIKKMQAFATYVPTNPLIAEAWNENRRVVRYGIEPIESKPKQEVVLVVGNFQPPELPSIRALGQTCGQLAVVNLNSDPITREQLNELYAVCDIFINLDIHNKVSIPMLEAMSAGCAVISHDLPGVRDVISGENGIICNQADDLRQHVLNLRTHKLTAKLGAAAQETIREKFAMDRFITDWDAVLNDTIKRGYII